MNTQEQPLPTESLVDLPNDLDVTDDFDVYINGILQHYPDDYQLDGRTLVFSRNLAPEIKMTKFQFIRAALGIAGTYGKQDSIDVIYEREGRKVVATGLEPRPQDAGRND